MTPDELKWVALSLFLDEMRAKLRVPMWGCQWRNDKDYQRFIAKVLKPLTKSDLWGVANSERRSPASDGSEEAR